VSRRTYLSKARENVEEAVARIGAITAKGQQLRELTDVYERLRLAIDQLEMAEEAAIA
jgi:uncharacterized protein YnzC (UPF0291/DUF896 family)